LHNHAVKALSSFGRNKILKDLKMTHTKLTEIAGKWLKKHTENTLIPNCKTIAIDIRTIEDEQPDVIGWSGSHSFMIEVKVGRGDFLKDCNKPFRKCAEKGIGQCRFYCCPSGLIKESELPEKWGLLYLNDENKIEIIKVADIQEANLKAERNILISLIRRQG
jgi:hypothetical protein